MICILAISKVSRFYLASVAEQAHLNFTCLKIPKNMFSHDVAQMMYTLIRMLLQEHPLFAQTYLSKNLGSYEPHHEKTCHRGL